MLVPLRSGEGKRDEAVRGKGGAESIAELKCCFRGGKGVAASTRE